MFATVFCAVYDESSRVLTYANAGHEPPMLLRGPHRDCLRLESQTPPAGLCQSMPALQGSAQLEPGDWLLIFTDGITEGRNTDGEEFGTDRLLAAVDGNLARKAEEVRGQILDALKNHSRGVLQSDDVTLIVAHVLGTWVTNG